MPKAPPLSNLKNKFAHALRGIGIGIREQKSFLVHLPVAIAVCTVAWLLEVDSIRFCILMVCIAVVLAAELFNSSLESLAKAITRESDSRIRDALDLASAAVLVSAVFAAVIGLIILLPEWVSPK